MSAPGGARMPIEEIEASLREVLETYPDAQVGALNESGLFCEPPPDLPLGAHPLIVAHNGFELVAEESRDNVLDAFIHARDVGACQSEGTSVTGGRATGFLFDVRELWDVYVLVWIEHTSDAAAPAAKLPNPEPIAPRFGRMWRDEGGVTLRVDEGALRMLGYTEQELVAIPPSEILHPEERTATLNQWFELLRSAPGSTRRSRARRLRADGSWLWVEITNTNRLDDPDQPHILSEMMDISEEMANADEVWQQRELLQRLTEALPVGVLQIDSTSGVVYTNDRLHQIIGVGREQQLAEQTRTIVEEDRGLLDGAVARVLGIGEDLDLELRVSIDGRVRNLQLALRVLRDRDEAVSGAIICVSDVTDSTRMRSELEHRANYDVLTQCLNRGAFIRQLDHSLVDPASGIAVVFIDLDRFKPINDRLGHAAGDELLRAVSGALRRFVRSGDILGRLGGDEFVVLCSNVVDGSQALEIGDRVADALRFTADVGGEAVAVKASIGVAWTDDPTVSADRLVATADGAMYEAKRTGEGRPVLADGPF